jgi:hypothetical protein
MQDKEDDGTNVVDDDDDRSRCCSCLVERGINIRELDGVNVLADPNRNWVV